MSNGLQIGDVTVPRVVEAAGGPAIDAYVEAHGTAADGEPVLGGIPFASGAAKSAAERAGLDAWDFEGTPPGGETGYTVDDIRDLAAEYESRDAADDSDQGEEAEEPAPAEEE